MIARDRDKEERMVVECDRDRGARYDHYAEQTEMPPEAAREHRDFVSKIADEFGFPLSRWVPRLPTRSRAHR